MTAPSLRSILEAAASDVETYRDPDIWEAQRRLSEVLVAAGLGSITSDRIADLQVTDKEVYVHVTWSAYSCDCDARHTFPASIIDAPDPLQAAARWKLGRERADIVGKLEEAKRLQRHWGSKLEEVDARIAAA